PVTLSWMGLAVSGASVTVNDCPSDAPPPGTGLETTTFAVPALSRREAGTVAWICVPLTEVIVSGVPFHPTRELFKKLVPVMVSVKTALPSGTEAGARPVTAGTG